MKTTQELRLESGELGRGRGRGLSLGGIMGCSGRIGPRGCLASLDHTGMRNDVGIPSALGELKMPEGDSLHYFSS